MALFSSHWMEQSFQKPTLLLFTFIAQTLRQIIYVATDERGVLDTERVEAPAEASRAKASASNAISIAMLTATLGAPAVACSHDLGHTRNAWRSLRCCSHCATSSLISCATAVM